MPRPLKNNELNEKIAEIQSRLDMDKTKLDMQKNVNLLYAFLFLVIFVWSAW